VVTLCLMPPESSSDLSFYVGGVGVDATEPELRSAFADVGVELKHVELVVNRATGFKRGFAFVYVDRPPNGLPNMPNAILERMRSAMVNGHKSMVSLVPARQIVPFCGLPAHP
jgi:hypothetical protein